MEYLDFRITMTGSDQEGKHTVLIESPAGGFTGEFVNPFIKADLDKKLIQGRLQVRSLEETRSEEVLRDIGPIDSIDDIEEIGNELSPYLGINWVLVFKPSELNPCLVKLLWLYVFPRCLTAYVFCSLEIFQE